MTTPPDDTPPAPDDQAPSAPKAEDPSPATTPTDGSVTTSTSQADALSAPSPFDISTYHATTYAGAVTSNRRLIPGLQSPFPMINYTSSMLIDDPVAQKICASLDEVLAPIISVLDCYDSYLDAYIAPVDFVRYMCSWILVSPELGWNESVIRNALSHAIAFYGRRGTAKGIEGFFAAVFQVSATVEESGSVTTSRDFTDPATWPKAPLPSVTITIHDPAGRQRHPDANFARLVLDTAVPAHVDAKLVEAP